MKSFRVISLKFKNNVIPHPTGIFPKTEMSHRVKGADPAYSTKDGFAGNPSSDAFGIIFQRA